MALPRILGSAVRHPLASAALVAGVAKGTLEVTRRFVRPGTTPAPDAADPASSTPDRTSAEQPLVPQSREEVVGTAADGRDLPEPVVLHAAPDPEPAPEVDIQSEDELVWTSESPSSPTAD